MLIGKLGAGKSQSGNGILGEKKFKSENSFITVTRNCQYGSATRNGLLYRVFDTPGINSPDDFHKKLHEEKDIARCLYCTSPGFHAIVLVISGTERISTEDLNMLENLDDFLGESAYKYMIIVISKVVNDESVLNKMLSESPAMANLNFKCKQRILSFGNQSDSIPVECLRKFDDILTELIKENARNGNEYYTHEFYEKATLILEDDRDDYIKQHPNVSLEEAFENVRIEAVQGSSPRDEELKNIRMRQSSDASCIIL